MTRIRASLTPRARSPKTPGLYRNLIGATSEAGSGPSSIRPPLRANLSTEGGRVEMRTLPITPTPLSIQPSPLLLPEIRPSQLQHKDSPKLTPSHDRLPSCSNHSSPGKPTIALPAHLTISLSTISCPSSPLPTHAVRARTLPYNPYSNYPPPLPVPPLSPELRPVALPAMTPRRLSDAEAPEESGAEGNSVVRRRLERDRLSGTTAVNDDQNEYDLSSEMGREVGLEADAEEAKVNRKVRAS